MDKRYIKSGSDERLIDTAELHRLFPIKAEGDLRNDAPEGQRKDDLQAAAATVDWRTQLALLQQRVAGLEADKADLRAERDRLLKIIETQAEQNRLLTDQRSPKWRKWWPWG